MADTPTNLVFKEVLDFDFFLNLLVPRGCSLPNRDIRILNPQKNPRIFCFVFLFFLFFSDFFRVYEDVMNQKRILNPQRKSLDFSKFLLVY